MKGEKLLNLFFGIFALVGIILLISAAIVFIFNKKYISGAEEINGVIETIETYRSSGDRNHRVYVSYVYNGQEYNNVRISFYSSGMYEGKDISLYCDPENPGKVVVKGADIFAVVLLLVMGIIFTCSGIIPMAVFFRRKANQNKVRTSGRVLYAAIDEIGYNKNFTVNGRHPYIIYSSYKDEYRDIVYRFKSGNLWTNPEPVLAVGSMIKVYVEEGNYKNYYVDAESMIQGKIVDYT